MSAHDELGPRLDRTLDHAIDLFPLRLADQRSHVRARLSRITHLDVRQVGGDPLDDLVVTGAGYQQPGRDRAPLPGMGADAHRGDERRHLDVGVVKQDQGGFPAKFEEHSFHGRTGRLHDPAADRRRAGEGDHVDIGMSSQQLTDGNLGRCDHIDHSGRNVSLGGNEFSEGNREEWSLRRTLEDHGAACRQRRGDLGERQLHRVVVCDDRGNHTSGLPFDQTTMHRSPRLVQSEVLGERKLLSQVGIVGEQGNRVVEGRPADQHWGVPALGDCQLGEILAVALKRLVELAQTAHPLGHVRRPVGLVECMPRRSDRALGVLDRRVGGLFNDVSGCRVDRGVMPTRIHELTVNEQTSQGFSHPTWHTDPR